MPRKLAEIPPPADSSSEEEETESEPEEEEEDETVNPRVDARNDVVPHQEETDDDDEESPPPRKAANPSLSDPDLDSESTQPSPSVSAFTIKLHKPSPKPNQVGSKRSADSDSGLPAKKSKAAGDDEPKKGTANQRLFSEEDELAILDGLVKFKSEKGVDPSSDMASFHDFIKDSLHVDFSRNQLIDKIRRLKKKYRTNIERGENGQDPVFSKSHDFQAFELSKKVWGGKSGGKTEIVKGNGKVQSGGGGGVTLGLPSSGGMKQNSVTPNQKAKNSEKKIRVKVKPEVKSEENAIVKYEPKSNGKGEEEGGDFWEKYPFLAKSLDMGNLSEGAKVILRDNLGMMETSKLKELDQKWKSLTEAELEIFVQKTNLVNEQVKLALDFVKS